MLSVVRAAKYLPKARKNEVFGDPLVVKEEVEGELDVDEAE